MTLFKKQKNNYSENNIEQNIDNLLFSKKQNTTDTNNKTIVKKKKIGFKIPKRKTKHKKQETTKKQTIKQKIEPEQTIQDNPPEEKPQTEKEQNIFTTKRKTIIKKNMKGKTVYLEDTGEKLGTVYDTIYDKDNKTIGYKIKDLKTDSVLSFPLDQFDENKDGLIFIPSWYTKAQKTIQKLEFKDRISPELTALLSDDEESNKELYQIFAKHDDEMTNFIEEAMGLKEMLNSHLKILQKKRIELKEDLMDLTEKRLIKDIDRKEFSEDVMKHRRKVNILDVNINKCKTLIKKLDNTSFGVLGKKLMITDLNTEKIFEENIDLDYNKENKITFDKEIKIPYKQKYIELKNEFEQLEEQYNELKTSVEKLFNKNNLQ